MTKKHPQGDRNFDDLVKRFQKNIYETMKGRARLAVLRRDFEEFIPSSPLHVLDVGAGEGRWASELVAAGHSLVLTDISMQMIEASKEWFAQQPWFNDSNGKVAWRQCSLQEIDQEFKLPFDLVNCHAVLEWLEHPEEAIEHLVAVLKPGGYLSVIFYNIDGLIFKNLLRGNFKKIIREDFRGSRGGLTPINPLQSTQILKWMNDCGLQVLCQSGIRVFHDYIFDKKVQQQDEQQALAMELAFSRKRPYRDLGRYIHVLAQRNPDA